MNIHDLYQKIIEAQHNFYGHNYKTATKLYLGRTYEIVLKACLKDFQRLSYVQVDKGGITIDGMKVYFVANDSEHINVGL